MENEYCGACNTFFNVIQRLRLKSAFLYTQTITRFDHDETYKLGHGPRTNTNHVHRPCIDHVKALAKFHKTVRVVAHTGQVTVAHQ